MASPMAPPSLGGFSLRVQLFSPDAHGTNDKPLRAFRVVTTPEQTIREFCKEASRIHEINYGVPLAIKKCQDDQEFDVTQTEVVGVLFANMSTIRVIQASASASVRDSVPPNSALRYNPETKLNNKRRREGSLQPNGVSPPGAYKQNKRQRVEDQDPDLPLPSRETNIDKGTLVRPAMREIPDCQGSVILGRENGTRDVRASIPETPPPESRPNHFTDPQPLKHKPTYKSPFAKLREDSQVSETGRGSPSDEAPEQSHPPRAKSASYHIQRPTERGVSVSTAATSPLSADQQPQQNGTRSTIKRRPFDPVRDSVNGDSRSTNENSVYENIESDDEAAAAAIMKTKANLKIRKSPQSGLHGLEWADNKFNTPPNGNRRSSGLRDRIPSELPLTPNSRERQDRQRQQIQANAAREVRRAAAEAAEQRQRDADEARMAKEAAIVEAEKRREEDRVAEEKRAMAIATAARIEAERLEKLAKDQKREEERMEADRRRKARIAKDRAEAARVERESRAQIQKERLEGERAEREHEARIAEEERQEADRIERERQARIEKDRREAERVAQEQHEAEARAAEAERLRQVERLRAEQEAVESARLVKEKAEAASLERRRTKSPAVSENSERLKSSTPARQPSARPQSSTPFIPTGRPTLIPKSALKSSRSSYTSSSPVATRASPAGSSKEGAIDQSFVDSASKNRRVSFDEPLEKPPASETPIRPPGRSTPVYVSTPKPKTEFSKHTPAFASTSSFATATSAPPYRRTGTPIPVPQKVTPIPPPASVIAKLSKSRSGTPQRQAAVVHGVSTLTTTPKAFTKSTSPAIAPIFRRSATPNGSRASREKSKSVELPTTTAEFGSSSDDSDEDIPSLVDTRMLNDTVPPGTLLGSTTTSKSSLNSQTQEPNVAEDGDDHDEEIPSNASSPRESRSPVIFNHSTPPIVPALAPLPKPAQPIDDEETQSVDDSASVDDESDAGQAEAKEQPRQPSTVQVPQSSPDLPGETLVARSPTPIAIIRARSKEQTQKQQRKRPLIYEPPSSSDSGLDTQDEVDFQLTSSMYEARAQSSQAIKSTPSMPLSSQPRRSIGASLSELNAKNQILTTPTTNFAHGTKRKFQEASDESSEEEDSASSDSETDSDPDTKGVSQFKPRESPAKRRKSATSSDSSSSESDSEESVDENEKIAQQKLAKMLHKIDTPQSSTKSIKSANSIQTGPDRLASQGQGPSQRHSRKAGKELKGTKKDDRAYLNNYSFTQPK